MKEIHVLLTGRLGNQLFQYAFAKSIQLRFGGKIYLNTYDLDHVSEKLEHVPGKFHYDMENYKLNDEIILEDVKPDWYADFNNFFVKILKKVAPKAYFHYMAPKGYLLWQRNDYIDIPNMNTDKVFINGWWQDFRFFHLAENELSKQIVPTTPILEKNKKLYDIAENSNSVCVSIRGGNYLVPKVKEVLFVCDKNYFEKSIRKVCEEIDNPKFIIFSDDLKWVKEYLNFEKMFPDCDFYYEDGTDTVEEKIRMMTKCKNYIISNSSFSWWAQYLSTNNNKKVFAPSYWFTNGQKNGLYMDNWILINPKE